jgi:hypothetical protein
MSKNKLDCAVLKKLAINQHSSLLSIVVGAKEKKFNNIDSCCHIFKTFCHHDDNEQK